LTWGSTPSLPVDEGAAAAVIEITGVEGSPVWNTQGCFSG
jgi:hypothetical protein